MWNHIRGPPYVMPQGNNKIQYIAPGFSSQYVLETQLVASLLCVCALSIVFLSHNLPKIANQMTQRIAMVGGFGVFLVAYSMVISLFRIKNGGYPFSILFR